MNKHFAILPDGSTAMRNSQGRTYTHCVATRPCEANYRLALDTFNTKAFRDGYRYKALCAAGLHPHAQTKDGDPEWKVVSARACRDSAQEYIEKHPTFDDLVTATDARMRENLDKLKAKGSSRPSRL